MTFVREDLWKINYAAEERAHNNGRAFRALDDGYCTACGRQLGKSPLTVNVHVDGHVILPDDPMYGDFTNPLFQGTWEIGPECAKRVMTADEIKSVREANRASA